jgi:hypothetical protein
LGAVQGQQTPPPPVEGGGAAPPIPLIDVLVPLLPDGTSGP